MKFLLSALLAAGLGTAAHAQLVARPQQPRPPFSYLSEEVKFPNEAAGISLAGTFTHPRGERRYPVLITITGSGPQDRDETVYAHRPLWVIADHLSDHDIAVLRFDDRGVGGSSGKYNKADIFDFAADVEAAIRYLKTRPEVDTNAIGLLGHSEGAEVAQIVAARNKGVAFVISASGPGLKGADLLLKQQAAIGRSLGMSDTSLQKEISSNAAFFDILVNEQDHDVMEQKARAFLAEKYQAATPEERGSDSESKYIKSLLKVQTRPEALSELRFDPARYLPKIQCPFLAVAGSKDGQVDAVSNLAAIKAALEKGGNRQVTVRTFEGLNHLLQTCTTCQPDEYGLLSETIAPEVLVFITSWVQHIVNPSTPK